ncbi:MAG: glutaredoxin family protein [Planctomycetaceae bacterium]|jgi:glutaredoxin|nr:glutaredoxin family protein [Planctomycetaceae bacterium]
MSSFSAILYSRNDCPLCDEAYEILDMYGFSIEIIDISQDSELLDKYEMCIPVIEIDGKVRFRGKINEVLLRRLLGSRS